MLSSGIWSILACPACVGDGFPDRGTLRPIADGAQCAACAARYPAPAGQLDLRPRGTKRRLLEFEYTAAPPRPDPSIFRPLAPYRNNAPSAAGNAPRVDPRWMQGNRLALELLAHFPRASDPNTGGVMLDLGCGGGELADFCRARTNMQYVGLDFTGTGPDLLGDAHALPFRSDSFDFILSLAVLEHLRIPALALREAHRVLKPGGTLVGTVAFLEPFHMESFYHHSHLGTANALALAGFEVTHVAPNLQWSGLRAISTMSLFPQLPVAVNELILLPLKLARAVWGGIERTLRPSQDRTREAVALYTAGGFQFVARKPAPRRDT